MTPELNYRFDEEEKDAIKSRLEKLLENYNLKEAEIILFSELDELGLRSEFYLGTVNLVISELKDEGDAIYE